MTAQSHDAVERAEELFELRERYREALAGSRSRASEVVDLLFDNPFVTARAVSARLDITTQGALNLVRSLEARDWLSEVGTFGRGGRVYWIAPEIFNILNRPGRTGGADQGERQLTLG